MILIYIFILKLHYISFLVEQKLHNFLIFLSNCALKVSVGAPLTIRLMLLEETFGLTLHGIYFSTEGITGTSLMAGQIKTSTTSKTCKCSEFPSTETDSKEIGNSKKCRG